MSVINAGADDPIKRLFHNEKIDTYDIFLKFEQIHYWPNNLRTLLAFERLESKFEKPLEAFSLEEITNYLANERPEVKLHELASSIEQNGVRVPLIVKDDGTLLDGNRRYFACSYIYHKNGGKLPPHLDKLPVWLIKEKDLNDKLCQKVLAEANFVSDYKISWSDDVKAKVISDYYKACLGLDYSQQDAFEEIKDVYSISVSDIKAYIETIAITDEYILRADGDKSKAFKLREQVLKKYVYFWEFRNKALKGRGALSNDQLEEVKPLFFKMMENKFFNNIKQVEPMIRSYHDSNLWEMLTESNGASIPEVAVLFNEQKTIKSSEDKVRNFLKWLDDSDAEKFSRATFSLLCKLEDKIKEIHNDKS